MPWDGAPNAGFTAAGVTPWLPFAAAAMNVADQRDDPASVLHLARAVIALRRGSPDLSLGDYRLLSADEDTWAFQRGERTTVALNLSSSARRVALPAGAAQLSLRTWHSGRPTGETIDGAIDLEPWEGVVITAG